MIAATQNKSLLAHDSELPNRDELLNADLMTQRFLNLLAEKFYLCELVRVKYRPGTSLRVLYRLETDGDPLIITARSFTNNRGRETFENYEDQKAIFYDEELRTVFWKFPSDRKIRQLDILQNIPQELENIGKDWWRKSELIGYAPEKCATVKCLNESDETFAYAKIFADDDGSRIFSIYENLQKQIQNKSFYPNALSYSNKYKTLFVEAVNGIRIADLDAENLPNSFRLFGEAIARFHEIKPFQNLPKFSRLNHENFHKTLEIIEKSRPENEVQARNLARKLISRFEFADEQTVSLHGDVHVKNAILQEDGRLTLIDLDQTSFGNPSADIGSFLGGLFYKECIGEILPAERKAFSENFFAGYEQIRSLPSEKSLNWHTAAALFAERSKRAVNRFRTDGLDNFGLILSTSEALLEEEVF